MSQEFQVEIQDDVSSEPENINQSVTTAGNPVTVNRTDGKDITLAYIKNPSKGVRGNGFQDVVYISVDGQAPSTEGTSLARGEYLYLPGLIKDGDLKIDSNNDNTNVEVILWG